MTPMIMIDSLVERIQEIVKNLDLEADRQGIRKAPQVWADGLPKKSTSDRQEPEVPWVIVRYLDEDDTDEGALATIKIIACTYSEDEQNGWRDVLNVVTRIKLDLLAHPYFGSAFRIERPIHTEIPEEQPFPDWLATMTVKVAMPQMEEEGGYLEDVY